MQIFYVRQSANRKSTNFLWLISESEIHKFRPCTCSLTANPQIFMIPVDNSVTKSTTVSFSNSLKDLHVKKESQKSSILLEFIWYKYKLDNLKSIFGRRKIIYCSLWGVGKLIYCKCWNAGISDTGNKLSLVLLLLAVHYYS